MFIFHGRWRKHAVAHVRPSVVIEVYDTANDIPCFLYGLRAFHPVKPLLFYNTVHPLGYGIVCRFIILSHLFDSTGYSGNFSTVTVSGLGLAFDSIKTWSGTDTNSGTIYTFTLDDGILSAAAVPEPSTYALLGLAGAALAAYRLRRRNK